MDHLIDDNDRLKPCPFCGGEATFDHDDNGWNWIECLACGASTNARVSAMDDCKPLLLEQWNKRAPFRYTQHTRSCVTPGSSTETLDANACCTGS